MTYQLTAELNVDTAVAAQGTITVRTPGIVDYHSFVWDKIGGEVIWLTANSGVRYSQLNVTDEDREKFNTEELILRNLLSD